MPKIDPTERDQAIKDLRKMFPRGSSVSLVLTHVSSTGMSRSVQVLHADRKGNIRDVSWIVAKATGLKLSRNHRGIAVSGCGMDMGFSLVYDLSRALWNGKFHCKGERCPSNDHSNDYGVIQRQFRDEHPVLDLMSHYLHDARVSFCSAVSDAYNAADLRNPKRLHSDAGYALKHNWL